MDPPLETAAIANDAKSLYVLVPMLNEAANVPRLMASMRRLAAHIPPRLKPRILILDDGSTDGTAATAPDDALVADPDKAPRANAISRAF